jgi:hypothetical protein
MPEFYPAFPCWKAPLREESAPKPGCACDVCRRLRQNAPWVPVVESREPYVGRLVRG